MDEPWKYHTKWSKSEKKDTYHIIYMWNLKKWYKRTYLQNRNKLTDTENKLMVTKVKGGVGINYEFEINRYIQQYIK